MNAKLSVSGALLGICMFFAASPAAAQQKTPEKAKADEKQAEKAKSEKVSGDIGLLDTDKNYMIVVTKEGKLVTLDYNQKTKVMELKENKAKISDIGLGSAASVQYVTKGDKKYVTVIEFRPAKGGD